MRAVKTQPMGMVLVTALLGTLAAAATPDAKRPAGAKGSELVAKVLVSSGQVDVVDSANTRFPAGDRLPVALTDSLKVAPQAFVVLVISSNSQVVRIDDDVELPVKDIAALHSGPAGRSLQEQVEQLLTVSENQSLKERLMGWMVAPMVASAPGAGRSDGAARANTKSATEDFDGPAAPRVASPKPSAGPASAPPAAPPPPAPASLTESVRSEPPPAQAPQSDPRPPSVQPAPAPQSPPPPPSVQPAPAAPAVGPERRHRAPPHDGLTKRKSPACEAPAFDEELRQCLAPLATGRSIKLRYLYDTDGRYRAVLERGLQVPDCASRWVARRASTCESLVGTWQVLEVPVK